MPQYVPPVTCLVVIKPKEGLNILERPSDVAHRYRAEIQGKPLPAYAVIDFDGVPYAWLVPGDTSHSQEWCRVGERDDRNKYGEVIPTGPIANDLPSAIIYLANAILRFLKDRI
jgi:hypothetical protein